MAMSKAQFRILQFIADHQEDRMYSFGQSDFHWASHYETGPRIDRRSAERLLQEGYIECIQLDSPTLHKYYNITKAGQQALVEQENSHGKGNSDYKRTSPQN